MTSFETSFSSMVNIPPPKKKQQQQQWVGRRQLTKLTRRKILHFIQVALVSRIGAVESSPPFNGLQVTPHWRRHRLLKTTKWQAGKSHNFHVGSIYIYMYTYFLINVYIYNIFIHGGIFQPVIYMQPGNTHPKKKKEKHLKETNKFWGSSSY